MFYRLFKLFNKDRTLYFRYNNKQINLKRRNIHCFIIKTNGFQHYTINNYSPKKDVTEFHENILKHHNEYIIYLIPRYSNFLKEKVDNKYINVVLMKNNEIINSDNFIQRNYINVQLRLYFRKTIYEYNVISILDPFSNSIYSKEFNNYPLNLNVWKKQFEIVKPDLFLVESVWNSVLSRLNLSYENNKKLIIDILVYCAKKNIKVLFWNKEDSINFNKFIWIAKLFPNIATTDNNCVSLYQKFAKHNNVFVLPFGITPELHNPFNKNLLPQKDILFAGRWYYGKEFSNRIKDMEILFSDFNFLKNKNLVIYDRNYNKALKKKSFPDIFQSFLCESIDYKDICLLYRYFKILYNVNSVQNSETMFSRRVLEAIACKTFVVSAYSKALMNFQLKSIFLSNNNNQTKKWTNLILDNHNDLLKYIHQDFIQVYNNHSVHKKLQNIFYKIQLPFATHLQKSFILYLKNENIQTIMDNHNKQNYEYLYSIKLVKDSEFYIQNISSNIFEIHYSQKSDLYKIFKDSYLFIFNSQLEYNNNYISNYLLNYKYLLTNISKDTIISKSDSEKNSNQYSDKYIDGTISFYFNNTIFNKYLDNTNQLKIYNIDCYDYNN